MDQRPAKGALRHNKMHCHRNCVTAAFLGGIGGVGKRRPSGRLQGRLVAPSARTGPEPKRALWVDLTVREPSANDALVVRTPDGGSRRIADVAGRDLGRLS